MILEMLALSLAAPPASMQTDPRAPVSKAPEVLAAKEQAQRLALQLYPEEQQVRVGVRATNDVFSSLFRSDPTWQKLEKEFPGISQAILSDLQPTFQRFMKSLLPNYIEKVANLYAQRFNADELVEIGVFFRSETGKKLASGITENTRLDAMMQEIKADPDKPTSYGAIVADHNAALNRVKLGMDAEDKKALSVLVGKSWFVKMAAVGPAMRKLDQDFTNQPAPAFEAEVAAVVEASTLRFVAQSRAKPDGK